MEDTKAGGSDGNRLIIEWIRGELSPNFLRNPSHEEKLNLVAALLQAVERVCEDSGYAVSDIAAFDLTRGDSPTGVVGIQFILGNRGAFEPNEFGSVLAPVYPGIPQSEVLTGTLTVLRVPVR